MESAIKALLPSREYMLTHAPYWWDDVGLGNWNALLGTEKKDWWEWTIKIDLVSEADEQIRHEDKRGRSVPVRALGAYSKEGALASRDGPGWRQNTQRPDTWEWPFRFKDYWNPDLRAELFALIESPTSPMSPFWIEAARKRYAAAAKAFVRRREKEQRKRDKADEIFDIRKKRRESRRDDPQHQLTQRGYANPTIMTWNENWADEFYDEESAGANE